MEKACTCKLDIVICHSGKKKFRRSITTANSLKAGQEITYNDILFKRPGTGIPADRFKEVIGRHVNRDIEENKTLFWEDLVK